MVSAVALWPLARHALKTGLSEKQSSAPIIAQKSGGATIAFRHIGAMTHDSSIDRTSWLLLILLSVLWGGGFFLVGYALRELPPLTIVFVRVFLGFLFLWPAMRMSGHALPRTAAEWWPFVVMAALINVIPFSLLALSQVFISSSLSSVLNATTPIFSVLVAGALGTEAFTFRRVIGIICGLFGVIVLRGLSLSGDSDQTIGMLLGFGSSLSYGFAAWWGRRALGGVPPIQASTCQLLAASIAMAIIAATVEKPWLLPLPSVMTWVALFGLAALSTSLAYIIFFNIMSRAGGTNAMLVTLLMPVTTIFLGHLVLGDTMTGRDIMGAAIICAALLVIDGRVLDIVMNLARPKRARTS